MPLEDKIHIFSPPCNILYIFLVYHFFCFNSENNQGENRDIFPSYSTIGTLRYEYGKARTGTAVDARISRGSRPDTNDKMCLFVKDGDVNNMSFVKHFCIFAFLHFRS